MASRSRSVSAESEVSGPGHQIRRHFHWSLRPLIVSSFRIRRWIAVALLMKRNGNDDATKPHGIELAVRNGHHLEGVR